MNYLEPKGSKFLMFHRKMLFKFTRINNGTTIAWGYSGYPGGGYAQWDIYFPITFLGIIGCVMTGTYNINASAIRILAWYLNHITVQYCGAGNNSSSVNGCFYCIIGY